MQEGTREVHATGLLFDLEDAVLARPARSVPGHRWARRRRIWRRSLGGVVGSAAGPAERGGGGGTAGAAADRPGRLHRRGVLPGAGQTVLASVDVLSDRALLATRPPPRCAEGTHCRVFSNLRLGGGFWPRPWSPDPD